MRFGDLDFVSRLLLQTKFDLKTGCWLWQGWKNQKGYGRIRDASGKKRLVYNASYEHFVGPIPEGKQLHHCCEQESCANPFHLEPKTSAEHGQLSANAKKTHCRRGHHLAGTNVYQHRLPARVCRLCAVIRVTDMRLRRRQSA